MTQRTPTTRQSGADFKTEKNVNLSFFFLLFFHLDLDKKNDQYDPNRFSQ